MATRWQDRPRPRLPEQHLWPPTAAAPTKPPPRTPLPPQAGRRAAGPGLLQQLRVQVGWGGGHVHPDAGQRLSPPEQPTRRAARSARCRSTGSRAAPRFSRKARRPWWAMSTTSGGPSARARTSSGVTGAPLRGGCPRSSSGSAICACGCAADHRSQLRRQPPVAAGVLQHVAVDEASRTAPGSCLRVSASTGMTRSSMLARNQRGCSPRRHWSPDRRRRRCRLRSTVAKLTTRGCGTTRASRPQRRGISVAAPGMRVSSAWAELIRTSSRSSCRRGRRECRCAGRAP